ncbi:sensor domain-containing diguanylate cyclase [Actinophytocola glycyrrhizae]|uniref:Diguanylate cyclase n=1 Tax=Actinophytocola glycyrrhizae TaxID=2044873 RepID=A0ABV9SFA8_9PSEU
MNDQREERQGYLGIIVHPRRWAVWKQPWRMTGYAIGWELVAAGAIIVAVVGSPAPHGLDWFRFASLAICATVHIQLSRRQEERRRSRQSTVHIDLTAIWVFPAVLVLPVQLALLVILIVRVQRWFTARRPLNRFIFSTASLSCAALLTHITIEAFGDLSMVELTGANSLRQFLVLALGGLVYLGTQVGIIGGFFALGNQSPTARTVLGSREDNELEAVTVALGMVTAILLANFPAALVIMIVVSVVGNRIAEVRQLQVDVRTDPKTGLLNMRGWREVAEREMNRASRDDVPCALLMVDLDHFKSINDTWGHPAGDDVLEYVSHALRSATRPSDVIGRFGGEEFVLLLPDADVEEAATAAERIRQTISELHVPTTDKRGGPVAISNRTTSIGVAVYPVHAATLDSLLQGADAAVYEAKEGGRNQVRLAA